MDNMGHLDDDEPDPDHHHLRLTGVCDTLEARGHWGERGVVRWPVVITHYFQTTTDKLFISCPAMMTRHQMVITQIIPAIMTSSPVNRNSWASFYNLTAVSQCKYLTRVINISLMKYFPKAWLQGSQWSPGPFLGDRQWGRHQGLTNGHWWCYQAIHDHSDGSDNALQMIVVSQQWKCQRSDPSSEA